MEATHLLPQRIQEVSERCLKCPCPYYFTGPHPSTPPHSFTCPSPPGASWCQYRQSHLPSLSLYPCLSTAPCKSSSVYYIPTFVQISSINILKLLQHVSVLTFRHRASCILEQAFRYSPENDFYIFNQQIYFII